MSCAKTSCCNEYDASAGDARCVCLVDCLAGDNPVSICTLPDNCGPADRVFTEAASCLDDACQAQCPSPGALGADSTDRAPPSGAKDVGVGDSPFAGDAP
ncbi:hypothetical protein [Sorangium sp. So ce887]|uniref:hypothetical protein n=1 Tax=Sorangium sp. So ce887 TaxID=3133324 RepID=UPI003F5EC03B